MYNYQITVSRKGRFLFRADMIHDRAEARPACYESFPATDFLEI